ncbi:MAG: NADH-quinone oxidoreductase subunit C [Alphaproteobacteria bacterium]|nr:NADH-quinone oxidoreductase subunit C [Alphaproteobacteria bacterium]
MSEYDRDRALIELGEIVSDNLGDDIESVSVIRGEISLLSRADGIVRVLKFLRDDIRCGFFSFVDLCGVDYPSRARRFEVVYHLLAPCQNQRVRVKIETDGMIPVPSVVSVFPAVGWFEREAYDLYGILFSGHPDLRRILTDYGFKGHPLRKDFPTTGFVQVRYNDDVKRVVYEPVSLSQEFRTFDFLSPWEGYKDVSPDDKRSGK